MRARMSIYLDLTREFNHGRTRAVLCSGQAVVLHRLAIASKDGDWILREEGEALEHVIGVLAAHGARYRFGAPLDLRWLSSGWSSHFEFRERGLRIRTDFFTRPPRVPQDELEEMWREQEGRDPAFTNARILARMKETDRERDYPVIGELARTMPDPRDQIRFSRSATDLLEWARREPALFENVARERPALRAAQNGRRALAEALQLEMLDLIEAHQRRLASYANAAERWGRSWIAVAREVEGLPLRDAHERIVARAEEALPMQVELP
jgi:hypothetical protein